MPIVAMPCADLQHVALNTTFAGIKHPISTPEAPIHQFRGIKYASVPARFLQSKLCSSYPPLVDATKYGPVCPQVKSAKTIEENLFDLPDEDIPKQTLKQSEFECLNLNITSPAGLTPKSRLPVMLWLHGGGDRGAGSNWVYDGGVLVHKSLLLGKPIVMVTINFRIGLFGFAASPLLREDNKIAGEEGAGNYGLHDQRKAMEWLYRFIGDFGGDPSNITLFGESSGAADIFCHLMSSANESRPLFQRAIVQSAILESIPPDVAGAGWHLSRIMSVLHVSTVDQLRLVEPEKLVALGQSMRATDDGVFFRTGWKECFLPEASHHHQLGGLRTLPSCFNIGHRNSRPAARPPALQLPATLQPLIIGDCSYDSLLWLLPASMWTPGGVIRRLKAICGSLCKASMLLRAYDISSSTPEDEIVDRVLELINDARVAWLTDCIAQNAKRVRGGRGVWRYVFDQEGPLRGIPHHAVDLIYLFDNIPLSARPSSSSAVVKTFCDGPLDAFDDDEVVDLKFRPAFGACEPDGCSIPAVDKWSYARVRDTIQERWIGFAYGEAPWNEDKVFVFGPEGETGERSGSIFEGRRRRAIWKEALEPLGMELVQKVGMELSRGPPLSRE